MLTVFLGRKVRDLGDLHENKAIYSAGCTRKFVRTSCYRLTLQPPEAQTPSALFSHLRPCSVVRFVRGFGHVRVVGFVLLIPRSSYEVVLVLLSVPICAFSFDCCAELAENIRRRRVRVIRIDQGELEQDLARYLMILLFNRPASRFEGVPFRLVGCVNSMTSDFGSIGNALVAGSPRSRRSPPAPRQTLPYNPF